MLTTPAREGVLDLLAHAMLPMPGIVYVLLVVLASTVVGVVAGVGWCRLLGRPVFPGDSYDHPPSPDHFSRVFVPVVVAFCCVGLGAMCWLAERGWVESLA